MSNSSEQDHTATFDITKSTLAQQIARAIAEAIVHGRLRPGERLNELELGARFGTSRAPIREATYILEREGVIVRHPRRGVFVKDYTVKELKDLYDTTYRLEEVALARVVDGASDAQMAVLHNVVDRMEVAASARDIPAYIGHVEAMFHEIFRIAGNGVLQDFYGQLRGRLKPFRFMSLSHPDSLTQSVAEYKGILAGLEARDLARVHEELGRKERRSIGWLLETRRESSRSAA
jgi:DNA-binding GntR family transcriptional regulator